MRRMTGDPPSQGAEKPIRTHNVLGRGVGRPFQKGQVMNPAGRPKGIEQLARQHTPAAIAALVAALKSPKERVPAAVALLNRGWGLPKQPIETDPNNPVVLHLIAATSISAQLHEQQQQTLTPPTINAEPSRNLLDAPLPTE
jgi:hypothetical protein